MPGAVGVRIMTMAASPAIRPIPALTGLAAGARHELPVNILCWGRLEQAGALAARNPDTQIVVDHVGMKQPFTPPARPQPFEDLPDVLEMPPSENLAIKITGACTYSGKPFPIGTSGIRWPACSTPSASIAACGAPTGPERRAADLPAGRRCLPRHRSAVRDRTTADGRHLGAIYGWAPKKA